MYKWNAEDYHQNSAEQQRLAKEAIARLSLKGNERILDIGCGDGKVTAFLASLVPNGSVLGLDSSPEMVAFAKSKFPSSNFSNLSFQQGDATNLKFDNEFDAIVSFNCLHWITDHKPAIEGLKKSLKPSGKILLVMAGKNDEKASQCFMGKVLSMERWKTYLENLTMSFGFYKADEYKDLLEWAGLKAKRVESIATKMMFDSKEELKAFIRSSWLHFTSKVPDNLLPEFVEDLANLYLEIYPPDGNGNVYLQMMKLEVEATKVGTSYS